MEHVSAPVIRQHAYGARDIEADGDDTLLVARASSIVSVDVTNPYSPVVQDTLPTFDAAVDIDMEGDLVAVAAGHRVRLLDAGTPQDLVEIASYPACGKVMGVEIVGDRLFHITRLGIGETDISDPSSPVLTRFSWIVPSWHGGWEVVDVAPCLCELISGDEDSSWLAAPSAPLGGGLRSLDVYGSVAYLSAFRSLIAISLEDQASFSVIGDVSVDRRIEAIRYHAGDVYLNLAHDGTVIVDAREPSEMLLAGPHDVPFWVSGVAHGWSRAYRLAGGKVEVALP